MDMELTIKLDEQETEELIKDLLSEESDENGYSISDMLEANEDELNWLKAFLAEHADLFRNTANQKAILARADLLKRIHYGHEVVGKLREERLAELREELGMN